jgi:S-sulfo-L-cysteine synthase (3-phospho-L-serine-dependent)
MCPVSLTSPAVRPVYSSGGDALSDPSLIRANSLLLIRFETMKLVPARGIIENAFAERRIKAGDTVIATSSGTFGIGLAHICRDTGLKCIVVSDPAIDSRYRRVFDLLDAAVDIVSEPAAVGGYQRARLDRVAERVAADTSLYVASQYDDPANPASYEGVAEHVARTCGPIDVIVGTVGSGGSMCGFSTGLRRRGGVIAVGVDTPGSIVFGCPDGKRELRGLGNSLMPGNVDHTVFDEVAWIGAAEAYVGAHALMRETGAFCGPTSGAAYVVAKHYAARWPDARIAVILPDAGYRYLDSVFDASWLAPKLVGFAPVAVPLRVAGPLCVPDAGISTFPWGRRRLAEVLTTPETRA